MTIASRLDSSINSAFTQASLWIAIKQAFINAGFSAPIDDYVSGTDLIGVWNTNDLDNSKTYGKCVIKIRLTSSFVINQQVGTAWNATTHVGTNLSTEVGYVTLVNTSGVTFCSLSASPEYQQILIQQGTTFCLLGWISPVNRPSWWDLANYPYHFMWSNNTLNTLRGANLTPYSGQTDHVLQINLAQLANANPITGKRDLVSGVLMYSSSSNGASGRTSDDVVSAAANGSSKLDSLAISSPSSTYLIVNNVAGGLAFRTS